MPRVSYVNGRYLPHREAQVHVEDRGFQFADSVYEVVAVHAGRMVDTVRHLDRLERSLREIGMAMPMSRAALGTVIGEVIRRNGVRRGTVYLQITRGQARRDHSFPVGIRPTVVVTARPTRPQPPALVEQGVAVVTMPDIRWQRRDIKSTALIANVLCRQRAKEAGAYEAWLVDEQGFVTEGTASNAWIVTQDRRMVTRKADAAILCGVTRLALIDIAADCGVDVEERPFTVAEAVGASEAFLTGTTAFVLPVVSIDGRAIGEGRPGALTRRLRAAYETMTAGEDA